MVFGSGFCRTFGFSSDRMLSSDLVWFFFGLGLLSLDLVSVFFGFGWFFFGSGFNFSSDRFFSGIRFFLQVQDSGLV
jgi:hypothetical protein